GPPPPGGRRWSIRAAMVADRRRGRQGRRGVRAVPGLVWRCPRGRGLFRSEAKLILAERGTPLPRTNVLFQNQFDLSPKSFISLMIDQMDASRVNPAAGAAGWGPSTPPHQPGHCSWGSRGG